MDLFNNGSVVVTRNTFEVPNTQYPIRNIGAVKTLEVKPDRKGPIICCIVGFFLIAASRKSWRTGQKINKLNFSIWDGKELVVVTVVVGVDVVFDAVVDVVVGVAGVVVRVDVVFDAVVADVVVVVDVVIDAVVADVDVVVVDVVVVEVVCWFEGREAQRQVSICRRPSYSS